MIDTALFCKALKFAAHATAKKDVRYYIIGVRLEVVRDTLTMYGTDGARIAVCSLRLDPTIPADAAITVPNDDVKRVLAAFSKDKGQINLSITQPEGAERVPVLTLEAGGVSLQIKGIDGVYPDARRAIPPAGREQGSMPTLDAKLVSEACAAIEPLAGSFKGARPLRFDSNGQAGHNVVIRPCAIDDPRVVDLQVVIAPTRF